MIGKLLSQALFNNMSIELALDEHTAAGSSAMTTPELSKQAMSTSNALELPLSNTCKPWSKAISMCTYDGEL